MSVAMKLNQVFSSVASSKAKAAPASSASSSKTEDTNTKSTAKTTTSSSLLSTTTKHKSGKLFEDIEAKLKQDGATLSSKISSIIGFDVKCGENQTISYIVDLKNSPGSVYVNDKGKTKKSRKNFIRQSIIKSKIILKSSLFYFFSHSIYVLGVKADCVISISDDDLLNVIAGKLNMTTV
jgi:hypothetical protein